MDRYRIEEFQGGWFIGDFAPALLRTSQFEIGWQVHRRGEHIAPNVHHQLTEFNFLARGELLVNGQLLGEGDIFVLRPGERADVQVRSGAAHVVCVKCPSPPGGKEPCAP